jgi:pyruvate kinase
MKNENQKLIALEQKLADLDEAMTSAVEKRQKQLDLIDSSQLCAAKNLIHYLSLRSEDVRDLQTSLHELGLSSLASSESHIRRQLQAIRERLGKKYNDGEISLCSHDWSKKDIKDKSTLLFGTKENSSLPYIMVTFDISFADNYALIKNLLLNGMNIARINCAHDDETTWARMIQKLRKAVIKTGKSCKIYMDLAGPKIRTRILNKGAKKGKVKVKEGQIIWLAENNTGFDKDDIVICPNETGIIGLLKKGDRVYIDDGIIQAEVYKIKEDRASIRIVRIAASKKQIKEGKGINFPDSDLNISSLTSFDISVLPFVCEYADMVGYSFIREKSDLLYLHKVISEISDKEPSIIIKIETPEAVINLPELLLEGMKSEVFGVMIARGDLAVEIGFERMGEIQEEILWICEAAHTPVIWATQVLETMNKSGMATRSEITDAVKAGQAECVMINKGLHTIEVIETLKDIHQRTSEHRSKKRFIFRPLKIAKKFIDETSQTHIH